MRHKTQAWKVIDFDHWVFLGYLDWRLFSFLGCVAFDYYALGRLFNKIIEWWDNFIDIIDKFNINLISIINDRL